MATVSERDLMTQKHKRCLKKIFEKSKSLQKKSQKTDTHTTLPCLNLKPLYFLAYLYASNGLVITKFTNES
jgi:hypothetical protein